MNFEELSKKLKKISMDTVTEVQKLNEIRLLNSRVNEEKKNLNTIYMEMGKKLYEQYKDAPLEGFEAEIQSVEERFSMIDLLQDQVRSVKGVVLCPNCNTELTAGERFCSNCGGKMPEVAKIEDKDVPDEIEATEADEVVEVDSEEEVVEVGSDTIEAEETVSEMEEVVENVLEAEEIVKDFSETEEVQTEEDPQTDCEPVEE